MSSVPVLSAAWRSGFCSIIFSLRLSSRLMCAGICDIVNLGS